jgi:hypothetical protein
MNKKSIFRFLKVFIVSLIIFELLEHTLEYIFGIDLHNLKWGWIGFLIIYGFKFHIFCCLLPFLWAKYKCRHKNCDHDHCD